VTGSVYVTGTPLEYPPGVSRDMAFTLMTTCNTPPHDVDGDGDVDLMDFSLFQSCFNGANRAWNAPPVDQRACACVDMDADGDVDLIDFSVFQNCFNGPNRSPNC
jgi:hypothetical protein